MQRAPTIFASLCVLVTIAAGTTGCGVPQPFLGVSVDASALEVRIEHASGIQLAGLALVLQCTALQGLIEGPSFSERVDVPLTINSRREGDVDIHHVRFESAHLRNRFNDLGHTAQKCVATMTLQCADESGETGTVLQYFRGEGSAFGWDVTDEVLAGIADTQWKVRTVLRDTPSGAPSERAGQCFLVTSVTRNGNTVDIGTGTRIPPWQDQSRCEALRNEPLRSDL